MRGLGHRKAKACSRQHRTSSVAMGDALRATRSAVISGWPCAAAQCSGVQPWSNRQLTEHSPDVIRRRAPSMLFNSMKSCSFA